MRGLAYVIAAIAAVGIMIGIASIPQENTPDGPAARQPVAAEPAAANTLSGVMAEAGSLTLNVPSMHCEFACYPRVKEAIEKVDGVQGVELAAQKEEGVIDNRQVIVQFDAGFDINSALALLAKEGFDDSDVVQ